MLLNLRFSVDSIPSALTKFFVFRICLTISALSWSDTCYLVAPWLSLGTTSSNNHDGFRFRVAGTPCDLKLICLSSTEVGRGPISDAGIFLAFLPCSPRAILSIAPTPYQSLRIVKSSWRSRAGSPRISTSTILPDLIVKAITENGRPLGSHETIPAAPFTSTGSTD